MSALPTLIHQTAWLLGLIRGLTEQRDVYKRLSCKTCDPFTLPSTFTSIFTLIWDSRRLYHTVFSCLEKCELWIYLYSLFEAFIKGGSEKMPTMISNAASALKLLWRTVSYIQLISPLQSGSCWWRRGEWIHVHVWLSPFTGHLKLSQRGNWLYPRTK